MVPNLEAFILKMQKTVFVFRLSFLNLQRAKDGTHVFDAKYIYGFDV